MLYEVITDTTSPSVTINQASSQVDPTNTSPINFTAVFRRVIAGVDTLVRHERPASRSWWIGRGAFPRCPPTAPFSGDHLKV